MAALALLIPIDLPATIVRAGPFSLGWHGLLTALAILVALRLGVRAAERGGVAPAALSAIALWAVVGGLLGARLFFVLDHASVYLADPLAALAIWQGGIAVYGAFAGGILAGVVAARRHRAPVWLLLDAAAPAMLVGQAIGRLGCLMNGDAWGGPTGSGWGLVYSSADSVIPAALKGVPTHPYPLYEMAACLALAGVVWRSRGRLPEGQLFLFAALGYGLIRFTLTVFRQEAAVAFGLQQAQVVAMITAALAMALLVARHRRPVASAASSSGRWSRPI